MQRAKLVFAIIASMCLVTAAAPLIAQSRAEADSATTRAIFLSDIHLNPFKDSGLVAQFAAQPAPSQDNQQAPAPLAAAQQKCSSLPDTPDDLFRSALVAMKPRAGSVSFVTVTGDLIAHQFIQCFAAVVLRQQPKATEATQYAAFNAEQRVRYRRFVQKAVDYITGSLHETFPDTPIYYAMGNNDTDCGDYHIDTHGEFLRHMAETVVNSLPPNLSLSDRAEIRRDFANAAFYSTPLAGTPNTRVIVLGDLFMSEDYRACDAKQTAAPAKEELAWLRTQMQGLNPGENVWLLGHIPPGTNLFESAKQRKVVTFLKYDFSDILGSQKGRVRVGLFAHTHFDGITEIKSADAEHPVTLKTVQSISPDHGNLPAFTLATIDAKTGDLEDYTLVTASKSAQGYTWPGSGEALPSSKWSAANPSH